MVLIKMEKTCFILSDIDSQRITLTVNDSIITLMMSKAAMPALFIELTGSNLR